MSNTIEAVGGGGGGGTYLVFWPIGAVILDKCSYTKDKKREHSGSQMAGRNVSEDSMD